MLQVIHFIIFAFCLFECFTAMFRGRANITKLIMFAGFGIIHGLVPAITPHSQVWLRADYNSLMTAAILTLLGVVVFSISWRLYEIKSIQWDGPSPGLIGWIESEIGQRILRRLFWSCGFIALVSWLGGMIASAGSIDAALTAERFRYRSQGYVYLNAIFVHLLNLSAIPSFICFFMPRRYRLLGITITLTMAAMFFIASKGGRTVPVAILGSLLMGYVLSRKFSFRRLFVICFAGIAIISLSISLYEIRKKMYGKSFLDLGAMILSAESYQNILGRDPLNYHQIFVAAVEHFPKDHKYLNGKTYLRVLFFYLPHKYFYWIKPPDTNNTFAKVILRDPSTVTTIPPTMMGEGYINLWGPPGVALIMIFYGVIFCYAGQRMRDNLLWFLAIGPSFPRFALLAIRGSTYEIITLALSSFIFVWFISNLLGASIHKSQQQIKKANHLVLPQNEIKCGQNPIAASEH